MLEEQMQFFKIKMYKMKCKNVFFVTNQMTQSPAGFLKLKMLISLQTVQ